MQGREPFGLYGEGGVNQKKVSLRETKISGFMQLGAPIGGGAAVLATRLAKRTGLKRSVNLGLGLWVHAWPLHRVDGSESHITISLWRRRHLLRSSHPSSGCFEPSTFCDCNLKENDYKSQGRPKGGPRVRVVIPVAIVCDMAIFLQTKDPVQLAQRIQNIQNRQYAGFAAFITLL